jgi:SAM-dependent methyltransferase
MKPEEYTNLERVEREHWYYRGKRHIVRHWLRVSGVTRPEAKLLDCGAGTGAFAAEMQKHCQCTAMDDHQESLDLLRRRLPAEAIVEGNCTAIPLAADSFDAVTALDVLEHIPDDVAAARELVRVLAPEGTLVVTVPAMMSLWSDWDESLHHQRRYDAESLRSLFARLPVSIEHCSYINVLAMPLVWLARRARALGLGANGRMEDKIPAPLLNNALFSAFTTLGCSRGRFPFGVGLLLVARKHGRS